MRVNSPHLHRALMHCARWKALEEKWRVAQVCLGEGMTFSLLWALLVARTPKVSYVTFEERKRAGALFARAELRVGDVEVALENRDAAVQVLQRWCRKRFRDLSMDVMLLLLENPGWCYPEVTEADRLFNALIRGDFEPPKDA